LLDAGHPVKLLVLFDSPTPGYPKKSVRWNRYPPAAWSLFREQGAAALLHEIPKHLRLVAAHRQRTAPAAPVLRRTLHSYLPRALDCPVVQVLALEQRGSTRVWEDERLGWRDFAPAFTTISSAGDHNSLLLPPNVGALAEKLEALFSS
jgi:thioesterase domain-containing protein